MGWTIGKRDSVRTARTSPGGMPLARVDDLVIEELGEELLVYDTSIKNVHCLSPTVVRVWRACDGETRPEKMASQLDLSDAEIKQALAELDGCELLATPVGTHGGISRRDLGVKATKVAAATAALPLILSVAAPAAAQTQSVIQFCLAQSPAPDGTNNCNVCNENTGANTLCCCCHAPANPPPEYTSLGNNKICAPQGNYCCDVLKGSHCTEPNGDVQNCDN